MHKLIAAASAVVLLSACASTPKGEPEAEPEAAAKSAPAPSAESLESIITLMLTGEGRDETALKAQTKAAQGYAVGSKQNPIRAWRPQGEKDYLNRLKCPSGDTPKYIREGSFGVGPYGTILDRYTVTCENDDGLKADVYMDMYHKNYTEDAPIEGFTIDD